jgi:hypothetical protein
MSPQRCLHLAGGSWPPADTTSAAREHAVPRGCDRASPVEAAWFITRTRPAAAPAIVDLHGAGHKRPAPALDRVRAG